MDTLFYKIVRPIITFIFKILFRPKIIGKENIPKEGACVLAGNHTKWLDPFLLISSNKRQVHFLAKIELFKGITKPIMQWMGSISVNRKTHDKSALENAINSLKKGLCIGIFPEGTIKRTDDIILPFKIGAVKMSYEAPATLVPFVITGKYKIFRKNICIKFLEPISVQGDLTLENDKLMKFISKELSEVRNDTKDK